MKPAQLWVIVEKHGLVWVLASLGAALAQFHMISAIMGARYNLSIAAAQGVVEGMPHWRIDQSRILGPFMVEALSRLTGSFAAAHVLYTIILYFLAGLAILAATFLVVDRRASWIAFLSFHLLCMLLINNLWHYAWDSGELLIFVLFCSFVLAGKSWRWMVGLFAISILNRESAFFIAGWMIADPLLTAVCDRARPKAPMAIAGLGCVLVGGGVVSLLRDVLLKKEVGPEMFGMPGLAGRNIHPYLRDNMEFIVNALMHPGLDFNILLPMVLLSPLVMTFLLYRRLGRRYLSLGIPHVLMALSVLVVGVLSESRVMFALVPFLAIGTAALSRDDENATRKSTA
jgi:hypothetical protein